MRQRSPVRLVLLLLVAAAGIVTVRVVNAFDAPAAGNVLRLGGLTGHRSYDAPSDLPVGYVKHGLEALQLALCNRTAEVEGTPTSSCFSLVDATNTAYDFRLELKWEDVGNMIGTRTFVTDVTSGWERLRSDQQQRVHARVSTTTISNRAQGSLGEFDRYYFNKMDADRAESDGVIMIHPLASGEVNPLFGDVDDADAQPTIGEYNFYLDAGATATAHALLSSIALSSGSTRIMLASTLGWEGELCAMIREIAPEYGMEVIASPALGGSEYVLSDGTTYLPQHGADVLLGGDVSRIANLEGAHVGLHCVSEGRFIPFGAVSPDITSILTNGELYYGNATSMLIDKRYNIDGSVNQRPPMLPYAERSAEMSWEFSHGRDPCYTYQTIPWSRKTARDDSGAGLAAAPSALLQEVWGTESDGYADAQTAYNAAVGITNPEAQWGNAGGAAAGEVLLAAFVAAFEPCDLSASGGSVDAMLFQKSAISCASGPARGYDRWRAALATTDMKTVLGRVRFDERHRNSAIVGTPISGPQFVNQTSSNEVETIYFAPPNLPCQRGAPGCIPWRVADPPAAAPPPSPLDMIEGEGQEPGSEDNSAILIGSAVGGSGLLLCTVAACAALCLVRAHRQRTRAAARNNMDMVPSDGGAFSAVLGRVLGAGSFGEVFVAKWNDTLVAVKTMRTKRHAGSDEIENEIKLHTSLRHPNIVATFAWGMRPVTGMLNTHDLEEEAKRHDIAEMPASVLGRLMPLAKIPVKLRTIRSSISRTLSSSKSDVKAHQSGVPSAYEHGKEDANNDSTLSTRERHTKFSDSSLHKHRSKDSNMSVHGGGTTGIVEFWLVMELCDNGSLAFAIKSGFFAPKLTSERNSSPKRIPSQRLSSVKGLASFTLRHEENEEDYTHQTPMVDLACSTSNEDDTAGTKLTCDERAVLTALHQIASACGYLHSAGVLHGDIKPDNVLLHSNKGGDSQRVHDVFSTTFKLGDFGLSRHLPPDATHASAAQIGTLAFAAPEVLGARRYGPAADVYSFGALVYEVSVGRGMHAGLDALTIMGRISNPEFVPTLPPGVPAFLADLCTACCVREPHDRPSFRIICDVIKRRSEAIDSNDQTMMQASSFHSLVAKATADATITGEDPEAVVLNMVGNGDADTTPWYDNFASVEAMEAQAEAALCARQV